MFSRIVAVALTAMLAWPASAASKPKTPKPAPGSRVEGRVLGNDGKPVRDAVVTVRALDGEARSSGPSDRKGRFRVDGLPYGWAEFGVRTADGAFLGDQALNLPPGSKIEVTFALLPTADKPESWWTDRRIEKPAGLEGEAVAGMAESSQKLTGVEYWKSPAGIAILASATAVALGLIAAGGRGYTAP